jgi:hypothetical protein
MYTRCFFLNTPLSSCTFCASPRCTFFAVVTSARAARGEVAIEPMSEVHLRKSCRCQQLPFCEREKSEMVDWAHSGYIYSLPFYFSLFGCAICESWQDMLRMQLVQSGD